MVKWKKVGKKCLLLLILPVLVLLVYVCILELFSSSPPGPGYHLVSVVPVMLQSTRDEDSTLAVLFSSRLDW